MVSALPVILTNPSFQTSSAPLMILLTAVPRLVLLIKKFSAIESVELFRLILLPEDVLFQKRSRSIYHSSPTIVSAPGPLILIEEPSLKGVFQNPLPVILPPVMLKVSGRVRF